MNNSIERVLQITGTHDHTVKKSENRKVEVKDEKDLVKEEAVDDMMKYHITEKK